MSKTTPELVDHFSNIEFINAAGRALWWCDSSQRGDEVTASADAFAYLVAVPAAELDALPWTAHGDDLGIRLPNGEWVTIHGWWHD